MSNPMALSSTNTKGNTSAAQDDIEAEETYAFRLFASTKPRAKAAPAHDASTTKQSQDTLAATIKTDSGNTEAIPSTANNEADPPIQRIRLHSPDRAAFSSTSTDATTSQVLGKRQRPQSYYLRPPLSVDEQERFAYCAVSGSAVRQWSARVECSAGLRYPWRVSDAVELGNDGLKATAGTDKHSGAGSVPGVAVAAEDEKGEERQPSDGSDGRGIPVTVPSPRSSGAGRTRTRKGKKTRLKIRLRLRAEGELERQRRENLEVRRNEEKAKASEKEAYLREKKKRLNRAKQIKKRERKRMDKGDKEEDETRLSTGGTES